MINPEKSHTPTRTWRDYVGLALRGFAMGAADVVPGVSGGTMAFVLGIYQELLDSIRAVANPRILGLLLRLKFMAALDCMPWPFLVSVAVGVLAAIFSLAHFIEWSLEQYPALVWSFFLGLVGASIWTVSRRIQHWDMAALASAVAGAVALWVTIGLTPLETPNAPWFLFLSGFIAICAMILPGISGSFILVLLGKYQYILSAVTNRDFVTLFIVTAGTVVGIVSFAQVLSRLLKRFPNTTIAFLIGLMVGSLRKLWPWKELVIGAGGDSALAQEINVLPSAWSNEVTLAIALAVAGFILVVAIEAWAARSERRSPAPAAL